MAIYLTQFLINWKAFDTILLTALNREHYAQLDF
jgi:hypothetical protein